MAVHNTSASGGVGIPVYAQLTDSGNQTYGNADEATDIVLDTNDSIQGITHSASVDTEQITIDSGGTYTFTAQPQIENTGGTKQSFYMWIAKDTGGGFADVANSNIKVDLASNEISVGILTFTLSLNAGDVIKFVSSVSSTNLRLLAIASPAVGPAVPSIILAVNKIK